MTDPIKVLIVDDHPVFAQAIEMLVGREHGFQVVGIASTGEDAVEMIRSLSVDVVLMDIDLPGIDGIEATRRVRAAKPNVQVVAITGFHEHDLIARAIQAGACGYVPKTQAPERVLETVRRAAAGEIVLPSGDVGPVLMKLQERQRERSDRETLLQALTAREQEVLNLMCDGLSTADIGRTLYITPATAQTHVKKILSKLGVHSKLEAVTFAMQDRQLYAAAFPLRIVGDP